MPSTAPRTAASRAVAFLKFPVAAASAIYKNCAVMSIAGYAKLAADTSGGRFVGIARDSVSNPGSNGDAEVEVYVADPTERYQEFAASGAAVATWLNVKVFFVDDLTVALTGSVSNSVLAGRCVKVISSTKVLVDTWVAITSDA